MAGHVTSTSSSVTTGQTVQAQLSLDLAPPIPFEQDNDEFTVNSTNYNVNTQQFLQVVGPSPDAKIYLANRPTINATGAFNFIYTIHATQQLWAGNQGTRFYIQVSDYLSYGVDRVQIGIEWGYDASALKSVVIVSDGYSELGRILITGYIPAGKQITIQSFPSSWLVSYDGSGIAGGSYETDAVKPFRIKYGTYKIGGQPSSITWPSGHPAFTPNYPGWIFSEATLVGQYRPTSPTWTMQALNASDVQIGSNYNPTSISEVSDIPVANFVVPAVAGIAKIRLRARLHNLQSSTMGTPFLDIPVAAGGSAPLVVSGPNPVTIEPGATYTVTANYPTSELTFQAVGGGSFGTGGSANVYTAPLDAGPSTAYQFKVTRGADVVTVGVIVPLRLTPASVSMVGGTTQVFTANADITTWSVTGGTLSGSALRSRTYTAPATVGSFTISATPVVGALAQAGVTVTSSGVTPTTGLRLEPAAGYSVNLNATPQVQMIGDVSPALWATLQNAGIDGATGNLRILSNTAFGEATVAQGIDPVVGPSMSVMDWTFNSTMQAGAGDSVQHVWELRGGSEAGPTYFASIIFSYLGSGEGWQVDVYKGGSGLQATATFTRTDTTSLRIEVATTSIATTATIKYRAAGTDPLTTLAAPSWGAGNNLKFLTYKFNPSIATKSNGSVTINKPSLLGGFSRWYAPNWTASRVDGAGNILGSYPVSAAEATSYLGSQRPQNANITCNAVGTARVRASYPSGVSSSNDVLITITSSGTALAVTTPAAGVTTDFAAGSQLTVEANDSPTALTYSCPGGTFGTTTATKNIFTAGPTAGFYTMTISRGAEVVTRNIRILMRVTPSTQSVAFNATCFLDVNTAQSLSYSATSGTVLLQSVAGGISRLQYNAPAAAGTFTINVTSSINNSSATVTVVASGTSPIVIGEADNTTVEPGAFLDISTNYPFVEVTFTANGGAFSDTHKPFRWFAPAQAGPYNITVTHAIGGTDVLPVLVPLRISPKNPAAVATGAQIQFSANYPVLQWPVTSGGTITAAGVWTAGGAPGSFSVIVRATIAGDLRQDQTPVTISGEGLALNVPSAVTLPPGGTLTITANYPTAELAFSATGGTFAGNVYTAPSAAGVYTITVTRGGLTSIVTVTVPVALTPGSVTLSQNAVQVFTANADVTNFATTGWTATGGVLSAQAVRTVTYTAGTVAGNYQINATTASGTITAAITNTGAASVPISIAGPALIALEPNATVVISTNKAIGTYSLTATGGTFEAGNVYRAPAKAGSYTITATDTSGTGGGADTLVVEVPLRLTPANPTVLPGGNQQFAVNYPAESTSWTTSPATLITAFGYWSAPFTQGTYTIKATTTIGDATTTATVATVELVIYGPDHITLEPGASYTVLSNLPPRAASYTAFGGSFAANIYTAPTQAGAYYFTATYQGQTKRVDVMVPVRISPKTVRLEAGESVQFTVNAQGPQWSVTGGGSITGAGYYTAPASGGTIAHVTATTSSGSDTATVLFLDEFPFKPSYSVVSDIGRRIVLVEAEDGTPFGRAKGPIRGKWQFVFQNREADEYRAARDFFNARFPEIAVLIYDADMDEFIAVYFDSEFHRETAGPCEFGYSFRAREVGNTG